MRIQQYGIDFYPKSDQNQSRGQAYSSKIIYFRVKNIGVITAATAHKNKAQGNKAQSNEHKLVVLFLEYKFLSRFLLLTIALFFAHAANLII